MQWLTRFESKLIPVTESGCWLWTAASHERGYGLFHTGRTKHGAKMEYAHRVSYELYKGVKPKDEESVCHTCDIPSCVNPDHLFLGTHTDNMQDKLSKRRDKYSCKLTKLQVKEIQDSPEYITTKNLAKKFNINSGHCSRVRRGLTNYGNYEG